jgi:signal transduction histidine kinase
LTALELLSLINQVLFIGLFAAALQRALHLRTRANLDTLLLFGSIAAVVVISTVTQLLEIEHPLLQGLTIALLSIVPLAMLRLVDDFRGHPRWVTVAGLVAFVGVVALGFIAIETAPEAVELALIGLFAVVGGYAAVAFAREATRTRGITRRRMIAVASGAALFIGAITAVLIGALVAGAAPVMAVVSQVGALGAVAAFWLGFMPPGWARRAMREPELRRFLDRSIRLTGVGDDRTVLQELHGAVTDAFGADGASIGLASADGSALHYVERATGEWMELPSDAYVAGRAFSEDRSLVVGDAPQVDPEHADAYRQLSATTVLATPIRDENRRLGVLVVYAGREPIFAEDDIALLELLADQLAILIEGRSLARQASEMRAREEAARLKEEFLASAAHDLRSPLTVVLGQAELLERRVLRDPDRPVDAAGVSRLAREARRLRDLVNNLLDAQRLEQGGLGITRVNADIGEIVREVEAIQREEGQTVRVRRPDRPLPGLIDRARILQVVVNLVENARKYGPADGAAEISVVPLHGEVRISVVDHGIGIPEAERERIFERFYRASNAQRVTDTGLGLGLFICRRIVEEHAGRIWHEPTPGGGSTFVVALPLAEGDTPGTPPSDTERPADEPAAGGVTFSQPMGEAAADA